MTNYEKYKDTIAIAFAKLINNECNIPCNICVCYKVCKHLSYGSESNKKWFDQESISLTQFEYDLLKSYVDILCDNSIDRIPILSSMKEKGYFKDVDSNKPIGNILEICEIKEK